MEYGNLYTEITTDVQTEHTVWARPYAKPAPRLLWIMALELGSNNARTAAELYQRLGGPYRVTLVYNPTCLGSDTAGDDYWRQIGTTHEAVVRETLAASCAGDWDVLLVDSVQWATLPDEVRATLIERIRAGAGLVLTTPQPEPFPPDLAELFTTPLPTPTAIQSAFPADHLATFAGLSDIIRTFAHGNGRIAVLSHHATWPEDKEASGFIGRWADPLVINFEYYLSQLCLAVLWTARQAPDVTISKLAATVNNRWPYAGTLEMTVNHETSGRHHLSASACLRDLRNRQHVVSSAELEVVPGISEHRILLDIPRPGRYYLDVWLRDSDGRIVTWASTWLHVRSELPFTVQLDHERYEREESITGQVHFTERRPADATLGISLFDNYNRLLTTQSIPAPRQLTFSLPASHITTPVAYLWCELCADGRLLGFHEQEVLVTQRPSVDDLTLAVSLIWEGDISHLACQLLRRRELSQYGVQYAYLWAAPPAAAGAARENQTGIPGALNLGTLVKPDAVDLHPVRQPCLSDPNRLCDMERDVREFTAAFRPFGPPFISLGGERFIGQTPHGAPDLCWSASCLASFREFVQEQYGTLDALNRQYGSTYARWDDVLPGRWADCEASGHYAPWVDHMLTMDRVTARFFTRAVRAVRETDHAVRVGWDSPVGLEWAAPTMRSSFVFQLNYDYPALLPVFTGMVPYDSQVERELIRSLCPPDFYFSEWWGGYLADRYEWWLRFFPWRLITKGANSSWYFHDQGPENALALDLRPTPWFLWANEELQELRAGAGKLLLNADVERDGIAVLWTQPGYWAATIGLGVAGRPNRPHGRMLSLLQDLGLSYRYITGIQLTDDILAKDGYRLLVLPWAQALSLDECQAIRAFVAAGGVVLADVRPGVMDPHCAVLPAGQLDDLFGIGPHPLAPASESERGDDFLPCYERSLPMDLVYTHQRGSAILLNRLMDGYGGSEGGGCPPAGYRAEPGSALFREAIRRLLEGREISASVRLILDGQPQAGIEITRYRLGDGWYLAVLPDKEVPRSAQAAIIYLPKIGHIYDVRQRRYLGESDRIETVVERGVAHLYAVLPYRIDTLEIAALTSLYLGDSLTCRLRIRTQGASATTHVVHLQLFDPDDRSVPWAFMNVLAEHGACDITIPIALNEQPGAWRLLARDVATGMQVSQRVHIMPHRDP